jgi:N-acetyl-anhydromuramyl-L-alanine amidase AmpD
VATIESEVEELERRALDLQPDVGRIAMLAQEALKLKRASETLVEQAGQVRVGALSGLVSGLENDLALLHRDLTAAQDVLADEPPLVDMRWMIPGSSDCAYSKRSLSHIKTIVVEHTATLEDVAPEGLARTHVEQGKPAIACHFLVGRAGTIYWTQPFEVAVTHSLIPEINRDSIAVSLAGSFNGEPPGTVQLNATADLLAWLLGIFGLDVTAIQGRRELEAVSSPGAQWLHGTNYKATLLALVRQRLEGSSKDITQPMQTRGQLASEKTGKVPRPQIVDVVSSLPKHPTLGAYPNRSVPISVIAIHHTDTSKKATVQQIAQYHVYGVRRDAKGTLIKAQWPGIGYHFVISPNGTIYQSQREQTQSYHVGGKANSYCLGISFIGRFMRLGLDGKTQSEQDQIPTPEQLRSGGQLVAWLMQEFDIPLEKVMGHRNVVGGYTACPDEHWEAGVKWRDLLRSEIQAAVDAVQGGDGSRPLEHYLLFWDHGTSWAAGDWTSAQDYIAHFRPTTGFSVDDAMQSRHVTIVGGPCGVSTDDEARLRAAGIDVHRLSGADEAETRAMLDGLVAANTPWPGAPPAEPRTAREAKPLDTELTIDENLGDLWPDEWTVPDDWERLLAPPDES